MSRTTARMEEIELPAQRFAFAVLRAAGIQLPPDFAGIGVIFYRQLGSLPFIGLAVHPDNGIDLPVTGRAAIATTLAKISSLGSGWHDGFHFVDVEREALTHLSQFVSPPLPRSPALSPRVSGARHMTAALASRVQGVLGVGILTNGREISYFSSGICVAKECIG
jgi:hypothetical protein